MDSVMEHQPTFDFSIIMAVYNVEPYLREAVQSIIEQDFGFERVQLILVDDGSEDSCGAICDEYAAEYPNNVVVIHQENAGVSAARNAGLDVAAGRFINFCDADDKLSLNTLSNVFLFFMARQEQTDVVSIPLVFFEGRTGEHPLNYKYKKGNRVINLVNDRSAIQLSSSSAFIKREIIENLGLRFNVKLKFAEDAQLLQYILCEKQTLGVVSNCKYLYRRRASGVLSAIQTSDKNPDWWHNYLKYFQIDVLEYCKDKFDEIPSFVQYTLCYDLQARVKIAELPHDMFSDEEIQEYMNMLSYILRHISDPIIMEQKLCYSEHKMLMMSLKYSINPSIAYLKSSRVAYLYWGSNNIRFCLNNSVTKLHFMRFVQDELHIEGTAYWLACGNDPLAVSADVNDEHITGEWIANETETMALDRPIMKSRHFIIRIPVKALSTECRITFTRDYDFGPVAVRAPIFDYWMPVGAGFDGLYAQENGWIITALKNGISMHRARRGEALRREFSLLHKLFKANRPETKKAAVSRIIYHLLKPLKRKQLWLIADKANRADDNGEAFFKYCMEKGDKNVRYVFMIGKDTDDYERLKKIGPVIPYMSHKHKLAYLFADRIISAYSHGELNNPFGAHMIYYQDIVEKCKFIFLQHGIMRGDLSAGLNRFSRNLTSVVVSAPREYESVINTPAYGYDASQVWLTGLPRYDRLYHSEKKSIAIMPTWRRELFGGYHPEDSRWDLKPGFQESDYYKFFHALFYNERLLAAAKKYGYEIEYIPHPIFFPYVDQLNVPPQIHMGDTNTVYRDVFARNQLMVTDYSSVSFDFAYLRKPVIYTRFDAYHYVDGYFDDERDGFGEVEHDLESTVDRIIEYMRNGCALKPLYRERIDNFFAFNDQNNCQRVYEKIRALDD